MPDTGIPFPLRPVDPEAPANPARSADETRPEAREADRNARRKRRIGYGIAGIFLVAALVPIALWTGFTSSHVVSDNAIVRAHLSDIGARVDGVLAVVNADAGDRVRAGEVLARFEDSHFRADAAQAQARMTALERRIDIERREIALERLRAANLIAGAGAEIRRQAAQRDAASTKADDAEQYYAARLKLLEDQAVSSETVRSASAEAQISAAIARAAGAQYELSSVAEQQARLTLDEITLREDAVRVLEAELEQARAQHERARADLDSTIIRAPVAGAIVRRLAQPGMAVEVGTPIVSMWLEEDSWVEAWIAEEDLEAVVRGGHVTVRFPALPGQRFTGVVERTGLTTDFEMPMDYLPKPRATRMRHAPLIGVSIRLAPGMPALVRPGMSAVVDIQRKES